jgi:TubC N-terminal docking domain
MRTSDVLVTELLAQCQVLGVTLAPGDQGALRVSPPGVLPSPLKEVLKAHKAEILQLLTAPPADVMSEHPCTMCGSYERWHWLDGRTLCRLCLVLDFAPMTLAPGITREETRDAYPA